MNSSQFEEISQWQNATFPHATSLSKIHHLADEIKELYDAIWHKEPNKRLEFADCIILLMGCASSDGMSYDDIVRAIDEKMKINYQRKWGQPNEHGVVKHIEEEK